MTVRNLMLLDERYEALARAQAYFGCLWKADLRRCWMQATYPQALQDIAPILQHLRNTLGPSGLSRL